VEKKLASISMALCLGVYLIMCEESFACFDDMIMRHQMIKKEKVGWLAGWLVGWLVGWLIFWLIGWSGI